MSTTARQPIGREDELGIIDRVLADPEQLPHAAVIWSEAGMGLLLLHGEAGIGKTSLWRAGVEAARRDGYRVLTCHASESETRLSYAGLADLLDRVVDDALPELPHVQRHALEAALLLGEPDARADERAVGAGLLGALQVLASDRPLVLAVDDLQWLDAASLAALRFALNRLADQPIAALFTVRGEPPAWLRPTFRGTCARCRRAR